MGSKIRRHIIHVKTLKENWRNANDQFKDDPDPEDLDSEVNVRD